MIVCLPLGTQISGCVIKTRSNLRAESFPLNIPKAQPYATDILDAQKDLLTKLAYSVSADTARHIT